jgi:hypothetical protein
VRLTANGVAVIEEAQPVQQRHDPFVRVEARRGEPGWFAEVAHKVAVGLFDIGLQGTIGQLMKAAAPHHVVHAAMETQLVPLGLE